MKEYKVFMYSGRNKNDKKVSGKVVEPDKKSAIENLNRRGIYVTKIRTIHPFFLRFQTISPSQFALVFDGLYRMMKVGIDVKTAIDYLIKEQYNSRLAYELYRIRSFIDEGRSISEAFAAANVFDPSVPFLIRSGEESGKILAVFKNLKEYYEKKQETRNSLVSAFAYPVAMLVGVVLVVLVLAPRIIKNVQKVYDQVGNMKLPEFTVVVVGIVNFLASHVGVIFFTIFTAIVLFRESYKRYPRFKEKIDSLYLGLPFVGNLIKRLSVYRFVVSLGILYKAGIPFDVALKMTADSIGNTQIRRDFYRVRDAIVNGENFSAAVKESEFVPDMAKTVLSIGENTGQLSEQLDALAEYLGLSYKEYVKKMNKIFEPLAIMIIGSIVLAIIGAIYLPFIDLMDAVKHIK